MQCRNNCISGKQQHTMESWSHQNNQTEITLADTKRQTNIAAAVDRERRCRRKKQTKWSKGNEIKFKMYFFVYIHESIFHWIVYFSRKIQEIFYIIHIFSSTSSYIIRCSSAQHFVIANSSTSSSSLSWAALKIWAWLTIIIFLFFCIIISSHPDGKLFP